MEEGGAATSILLVGLGGAVGAIGRYLLGLILPTKTGFPIGTLLVNLLGCFCIGLVAGLSERKRLPDGLTLFLKTGVCGGFTTYSAFSLETLELLEKGRWLMGCGYVALSLLLCIVGALAGQLLTRGVSR